MAVISRITTQQKRKNRYNIFLDHGQGENYGFSVDEDILIEFNLHKGQELSDETIDLLVQKDDLHKTYTQAIHFLSLRMRSRKEIEEYLLKKETDVEEITIILKRLENENLINDREFAEAFLRTRVNTTSKGPLLVKRELIEKGIGQALTDEVLDLYPYDEQLQKAKKFIEKKLTASRSKSFQQQLQTLKQSLMHKGFTNDVINEVFLDIEEQKDDDAEWDAIVLQGEKLVRKYEKKADGNELKHKVKAGLYRKGFSIEEIERFLDTVEQNQ